MKGNYVAKNLPKSGGGRHQDKRKKTDKKKTIKEELNAKE